MEYMQDHGEDFGYLDLNVWITVQVGSQRSYLMPNIRKLIKSKNIVEELETIDWICVGPKNLLKEETI